MKELIRELMNQTGVPTSIPFDQWCEKFAKLIVREVFAKIEDERFEIYQPVKESVMKHFGVEE